MENFDILCEQDYPVNETEFVNVNVNLLDSLVNLAGELVLCRNQLLQGLNTSNYQAAHLSGQRIDLITSELQETIMQTRMQPIHRTIENFRMIIRNRSRKIGKSIDLALEGKEVELDKTMLEKLKQPLQIILEHAVDNFEKVQGMIAVHTFHDAGQVNIRISCFCKQGNSDANRLSDAAACIEALGGGVNVDVNDSGQMNMLVKLPLTLAIIPSQIISFGQEKVALPQANLDELLRIPADQIGKKVEKVGDTDVIRLRGELIPLIDLSELMEHEKKYTDPYTGFKRTDRRKRIADRRAKQNLIIPDNRQNDKIKDQALWTSRRPDDRRQSLQNVLHIAVVSAGNYKFGLIVDRFHETEEIVVKPLGSHLKKCTAYAGATIMGDGKIALILDVANIGKMVELSSASEPVVQAEKMEKIVEAGQEKKALITFKNNNESFCASLDLVDRIERVEAERIETAGNKRLMQYRGGALALYELAKITDTRPLEPKDRYEVIVFKDGGKAFGLMVTPPVDTCEAVLNIDERTLKGRCVSGSIIINKTTFRLLDIPEVGRRVGE